MAACAIDESSETCIWNTVWGVWRGIFLFFLFWRRGCSLAEQVDVCVLYRWLFINNVRLKHVFVMRICRDGCTEKNPVPWCLTQLLALNEVLCCIKKTGQEKWGKLMQWAYIRVNNCWKNVFGLFLVDELDTWWKSLPCTGQENVTESNFQNHKTSSCRTDQKDDNWGVNGWALEMLGRGFRT